MLRTYTALKYSALAALDGDIGAVKDVFFDEHWVIRYVVVTTSNWLLGRSVLLSPGVMGEIDPWEGKVSVGLTRNQIRHSPDIEADRPITRWEEMAHHRYYGTPVYWGGFGVDIGPLVFPILPGNAAQKKLEDAETAVDQGGAGKGESDSHLRSANDVHGYHIQASDGGIGHVENFLFDADVWQIKYLILDTKNWLRGKRVVVPTGAIEKVDWLDRSVAIRLSREEIRNAPEFDPLTFDGAVFAERTRSYFERFPPPR